jgi:hypothetical protein
MPEIEHPREERWLRALFLTLALLYVVPFWIVHYLPTVDGPCHTYNAWVLAHHGDPRYPLFQRYYEVNAAPYPNWTGHAVMALLMVAGVPPLAAEKVLASVYALTFLSGVWYLVGSARPGGGRWLAFLAFPFVFNHLFQYGFYNFSLSLALFPFVLGFWWRYRDRPTSPVYIVGINLLLALCYFSHILSFGLALVAIAVLWLATLRRDGWRRHALHVPVLAPQAFLPIWYLTLEGGDSHASWWGLGELVRYFVGIEALVTFGAAQRWLALILAAAFLVLLVLTLRREGFRPWRDDRAFLVLAAVLTLLYFVSPEGASGGTMLKYRLCLYPYLVLIPWLAPGLGPRSRRIGAGLLALAALLNLGSVIHWYERLSGGMEQYLAGLDPVAPDTRVLPLLFGHETWGSKLDVRDHAIGYKAIEKGLIDWDNYEATTIYFPVRFRDPAPNTGFIETDPGRQRMTMWRHRADYVYTWRMPPGDPFTGRLEPFYARVAATGGGVLWKRKGLS